MVLYRDELQYRRGIMASYGRFMTAGPMFETDKKLFRRNGSVAVDLMEILLFSPV